MENVNSIVFQNFMKIHQQLNERKQKILNKSEVEVCRKCYQIIP